MLFNWGEYTIVRKSLLGVVAVLLVALAGCSNQPSAPVPSGQLKLGFSLQSTELASLVTSVTLQIQYPDSTVFQTLQLVNGEIHDTLSVEPAESIVFTLRAFDSSENLLYIGSATRSVAAGQRVEVQILLLPNPELLMLRIGPLFQSVTLATDNLVSVSVDVHNVDSLFGAAFRVYYDTLSLGLAQVIEGDFLSGTPPSQTIAFYRDSAGCVAYSVSRVRQTGAPMRGVSGSGRLATLLFTKRAARTSSLSFDPPGPRDPQVPQTTSLIKPDGKFVNRFARLVRESATVEIR